MRRDFYCLTPDEGENHRYPADASPQAHDLASALRALRAHPAARPAMIGTVMVGSIAALAAASPISALLDPAAEANPPTSSPAAPPSPPTTSRPAETAEPPAQGQAELDTLRAAVVRADHTVQAAERAVPAASKEDPRVVLDQLRPPSATVTSTTADLTRVAEALRTLRTAAGPDVRARIPAALTEAENLLHRAAVLRQTYDRLTAEAQQSVADNAAEHALRQADGPVRAAEAAADLVAGAVAAVDQALTSTQTDSGTTATLTQLTKALDGAAGPAAGGVAAAKAAIEATKPAASHLRTAGQRLVERATKAAAIINRTRDRIPDLRERLASQQRIETATSVLEIALAARSATGATEEALGLARRELEDAARVFASGDTATALRRAEQTQGTLTTAADRLRTTTAAVQELQRALAATPTIDDPVRQAATALQVVVQDEHRRQLDQHTTLVANTRTFVEQATASPARRAAGADPRGQASRVPADPSRATAPQGQAAAVGRDPGAVAARAALTQLGVPYRWGGTSPGRGFDCSGLTQWAYRQAGVHIPRTSGAQAVGTRIARDQLRPGDLVVWQGHVAMYLGNGRMVEAGDPVQVSKLRTTNLNMTFLGYYRPSEPRR